ncbi:MAG: RNA chaperone Hfq [Acidobacteria bacterium]|nr:RNA chaperone Hfq [Acidobacteriota bacterium]
MRFERPPFRKRPNHPGNNGQQRFGQGNNGQRPRMPEPPSLELDPMIEEEEDLEDAEPGLNREAEYLRQLTEDQTLVVLRLRNGESYTGHIEYYDKRFIRLTRKGAPNLFVFKHDIKYLSEA